MLLPDWLLHLLCRIPVPSGIFIIVISHVRQPSYIAIPSVHWSPLVSSKNRMKFTFFCIQILQLKWTYIVHKGNLRLRSVPTTRRLRIVCGRGHVVRLWLGCCTSTKQENADHVPQKQEWSKEPGQDPTTSAPWCGYHRRYTLWKKAGITNKLSTEKRSSLHFLIAMIGVQT